MASSKIRALIGAKNDSTLEGDTESSQSSNNCNNPNFRKYQLCLKNVPKNLSVGDIKYLCSNNGDVKVDYVHISSKVPYVFVTFPTLNDTKKALEKFQKSSLGIEASFSRQTELYLSGNQSDQTASSISDVNDNISVKTAENLDTESISSGRSNGSRLKRENLRKNLCIGDNLNKDNDMSYCNGRVAEFEHEDFTLSGHCKVCRAMTVSICERCGDFYCSTSCQRKDWLEHRYICFKIPNLVKATSNVISSFLQDEVNLSKLISKVDNLDRKEYANISRAGGEELNYKEEPTRHLQSSNKSIKEEIGMKEHRPKLNSTTETEKQYLNSTPQQQEANKLHISNDSVSVKSDKSNLTPRLNISSKMSVINMAVAKSANEIMYANFPKNGTLVQITAITKLNKIFVRSLEGKDKTDYLMALRTINAESKKMKTLNVLPKRGDLVVTDHDGSGYYRAIVLKPENQHSIEVAYVDFGSTEVKSLSDLKEMPKIAATFNRYTFLVQLKNVPTDLQPNAEILNSFRDNEMIILHNCNNDNIKDRQVELVDPVTKEKMIDQIIKMHKGIKNNTNSVERTFASDIKVVPIPEGKNVPVYIFDNSMIGKGYISMIKEDDALSLERFNEEIQQYCAKEKTPYCPSVEELCLVKFDEDGIWYRAECYDKTGIDTFSVVFMDYGNITNVDCKNIRKYPKNFTHPCMTSFCLIEGLPDELSSEAVEKLKDFLPTNTRIIMDEILIVKDDENKDNNVARLPTIIKILQNQSLI